MKVSPAQKLILQMLCDLYKKLDIDGEIDHKFVASALHSDQLWAFEWQYQFLQDPDNSSNPPVVKETVDILDMWSFLEHAFEQLDEAGKERVQAGAGLSRREVRFPGFDANHEDHFGVASFLIQDMGRFSEFSKHSLNSHSQSVPGYLRMLTVFEQMRPTIDMGEMSPDQIIGVLKARRFS
jgi:uncharacterized protein YfbU (UPF0304 family)